MSKPVCAVVGVGPGNGAAFARRFSKAGHAIALLSRTTDFSNELASELGNAAAYACDVSDGESVAATFGKIRSELGDPEVLLYNAGSGAFGSIDDIDASDLEQNWRINVLGLFSTVRQVLPAMRRSERGSIIITGATASLRGGAKFAAFASAKAAQRSLAQSMARKLGPEGIHVALVIVDGVIDTPRARQWAGDKPDSYFLSPEDIAETVLHLAEQNRSAWTFEADLRPFSERW